jgi:hypothetical protein
LQSSEINGVYPPPFPSPFWRLPISVVQKPTLKSVVPPISVAAPTNQHSSAFLRDVAPPHQESFFLRITFRHHFFHLVFRPWLYF